MDPQGSQLQDGNQPVNTHGIAAKTMVGYLSPYMHKHSPMLFQPAGAYSNLLNVKCGALVYMQWLEMRPGKSKKYLNHQPVLELNSIHPIFEVLRLLARSFLSTSHAKSFMKKFSLRRLQVQSCKCMMITKDRESECYSLSEYSHAPERCLLSLLSSSLKKYTILKYPIFLRYFLSLRLFTYALLNCICCVMTLSKLFG